MKYKFQNKIKFIWTRDGTVHARADESTPMMTFECLEDIPRILGPVNKSPEPLNVTGINLDTCVTLTSAAGTSDLITTSSETAQIQPTAPTAPILIQPMTLRGKRKTPDQENQNDKPNYRETDPEAKLHKIPRGPSRTRKTEKKDEKKDDKKEKKVSGKPHAPPPPPPPLTGTAANEAPPAGSQASTSPAASPAMVVTSPTSGNAVYSTPPST